MQKHVFIGGKGENSHGTCLMTKIYISGNCMFFLAAYGPSETNSWHIISIAVYILEVDLHFPSFCPRKQSLVVPTVTSRERGFQGSETAHGVPVGKPERWVSQQGASVLFPIFQ